MADDIGTWLKKQVEGDFKSFRKPMNTVFKEVVKTPKPPSPEQEFYQFMKMPQEERLLMAQGMGREMYGAHIDRLVEMGTQIIGPAANSMRAYFDQDLAMLPAPELANPADADYASLIDQAMAMELPEFEEDV